MMAVRYHRCTCHQRYNGGDTAPATYSAVSPEDKDLSYSKFVPCNAPTHSYGGNGANNGEVQQKKEEDEDGGDGSGGGGGLAGGLRGATQPWYFHAVASGILIVHGLTFLVPSDPTADEKDMVRTVAGWLGYDMDWIKVYIPYAQGLAAVFNISLGLVSWWTTKDSDRYNRLIQLRVFAFCVNILHAYITGPVVTQTDEAPEKIAASKAVGRIIGLFRLSYLTPGLMAAGVTEVIVDKNDDKKGDDDYDDEDEEAEDGEEEMQLQPAVVTPVRMSRSEEKRQRRRRK